MRPHGHTEFPRVGVKTKDGGGLEEHRPVSDPGGGQETNRWGAPKVPVVILTRTPHHTFTSFTPGSQGREHQEVAAGASGVTGEAVSARSTINASGEEHAEAGLGVLPGDAAAPKARLEADTVSASGSAHRGTGDAGAAEHADFQGDREKKVQNCQMCIRTNDQEGKERRGGGNRGKPEAVTVSAELRQRRGRRAEGPEGEV